VAKLVYSAITSLDGYVADAGGSFDWAAPDEELHAFVNDLYGRRMYEVERDFHPEAVRRMKASAEHDLTVGGPGLAAAALGAGLVDECHLFLTPVVVGGGTRSLPDGVRLDLELLDERRFGSGVVHLHHRTRA
jgi:dihydrofolate reductase